MEDIFEKFACGKVVTKKGTVLTDSVKWRRHPSFEGVEMKDLVTLEETGGSFSVHLVKIAPNMKIGSHIHEAQTEIHEVLVGNGTCTVKGKDIGYAPGTVCMIEAGTLHEVTAGSEGLCLSAKFITVSK